MSRVTPKCLIVVTSQATLGDSNKPTGYYLAEVSHPYAALIEKGVSVDIGSPKGGKAPLDPVSLNLEDASNKAMWEDKESRHKLENTIALGDVNPDNYNAIFFAGGHGVMWDFKDDPNIPRIAAAIYEKGGVVGAVCHGPAALVNVRLSDGSYLVAGKNVAGFSNDEENDFGIPVPFLLETALIERGARYSKGPLWKEHIAVDGRLVTGQNPASAARAGRALAKLLVTH